MRLLFSTLRVIALTLVLLLVIASATILYVLNNPERIKKTLQQGLTVLTERPLEINGAFEAELGREIRIYAEDVQWANAGWATSPNMLEVAKLDVTFELASLLDPPVIIRNAVAQNGKVEFAWNTAGVSNWDFFADRPDDPTDTSRDALPLLLDTAQLENVQVSFATPELTGPIVWQIDKAEQQQDQSNRLVIGADTWLNEKPTRLDAIIGPFPQLIVAGEVDLIVNVEGPIQALELQGSTSKLAGLEKLNLDAVWRAAESADVLEVFRLPPATTGPLLVKANIVTGTERVAGTLDGDIGDFKIDGDFSAPTVNTFDDLHVDLRTRGPRADLFGMLAGIPGLPKQPYELRFKADTVAAGLKFTDFYARTAGAEFNGDALLPQPPSLIDADVALQLRGPDLSAFDRLTPAVQLPESEFSAELRLKGGNAGVNDLLTGNFNIGEIDGDLTADLTERPDYIGSTLAYGLKAPDLQKFADYFGIELLKAGTLSIDGQGAIETAGIRLQNLAIRTGGNTLTLDGLLPDEPGPVTLASAVSGQNFREFSQYFLPGGFGPGAVFDLSGETTLSADGILTTNNSGNVGSTDVGVRGTFNTSSTVTDLAVDLEARGSDIDDWLQDYITEERIQDEFQTRSRLTVYDDRFDIDIQQLEVRQASVEGKLSTRLNDDPDAFNLSFDLTATGKNLAQELAKLSAYEPAPVAYALKAAGEVSNDQVRLDDVSGTIGSATIAASGSLGFGSDDAPRALTVSLSGDRLSDLGAIEGWELVDSPFDLNVQAKSQGGLIEATNMKLKLGPNDVRGDLSIATQDRLRVRANLASENFIVGAVLTKEQNDKLDQMVDGDDTETPDDGRVIPDFTFPTELLNTLDAQLQIAVGTGSYRDEILRNIKLDATLNNGALDMRTLSAETTFGGFNSNFRLTPVSKSYELEFGMDADKVRIPTIKSESTDRIPYRGNDIDIYVTGTGRDLREVAANANGFIWVRGERRQIDNVKFSGLFGDATTEIFRTVNPFVEKDEVTTIECERYLFEIEDGIMRTSPILFLKTDKLNISSAGSINLQEETLRLGIETSPRKGIGLSASDLLKPFVRVGGTMAEPRPEIDPKGSLIEGGAAFYTAGLSILAKSLYQRWIKADKDCSEYTTLAREIRMETDPGRVPAD